MSRSIIIILAVLLTVHDADAELIWHFPFTEGSMQNSVAPSFSFENQGATEAPDRCGRPSRSIYLDGTASLSAATSDHPLRENRQYSYAFWAKFMDSASTQSLIESGHGSELGSSSIRYIPENQSDLGVSFIGWMNNHYSQFHPPVGSWFHYAIVRGEADRSVKLYVDGQLHSSGTLPNDSNQTNSQIFIGRSLLEEQRSHFTGFFDEFRLYDHALSASEVKSLFEGEMCTQEERFESLEALVAEKRNIEDVDEILNRLEERVKLSKKYEELEEAAKEILEREGPFISESDLAAYYNDEFQSRRQDLEVKVADLGLTEEESEISIKEIMSKLNEL